MSVGRPTPTEEEAAAIAAAIYVGWPRPAAVVDDALPTAWRFSGRWWRTPSWRRPTQRRRP